MEYMDKTLTCLQCGDGFTFSVSEQEFFSRECRRYEPRHCPECQQARNGWCRGSRLDASLQALIQSVEYRVGQSVLGPEGRSIWSDSN
jgi:hypothetical protein